MNIHYREKELLRKYLNNDCSREELEELLDYLKSEEEESYEEITSKLWEQIGEEKQLEKEKADYLLENAVNAGESPPKKMRLWQAGWYKVAAAVLLALILGAGAMYLLKDKKVSPAKIAQNSISSFKNDVKPGGTKAILKSGGAQVVLNKKDTSFTLGGNKVNIQKGDVKIAREQPVEYTLITPRGGEYSLELEDGTKVWLNADSKLVYPSVFEGDSRTVRLRGEAYFEVATDAARPFIVRTEKQDIRVLGTAFNLQAYPDERKSITTLVNGKVQVNKEGERLVLKPGQQAILRQAQDGKELILVKNADVKQAIAWKEGYFRFDFTDIHEIMRRLSRWYDVEVVFEEGVGHKEFLAAINRDNNISQVLKMLEGTGEIRFKIEGKKVTVMRMSQAE